MKRIFLAYFLITFFTGVCQQPSTSCNQSTTVVNTTFYPNTTTNITSTLTNISGIFLCGPNTIVYDTSNVSQSGSVCRIAFVSPSSTLVTNSWACAYYEAYFVKNNATIIFPSNTNNIGVYVYYEPGAVIIDNSSGVSTYSCSSITFPSINCTATGIQENNLTNSVEIYPNPVNDKLNIKFTSNKNEVSKVQIINSVGQVVKEIDLDYYSAKVSINIEDLSTGIYVLNIKGNTSFGVSKRFVIAR